MSDIFIAYAHTDRKRAKLLARKIGEHGWSVWWDPQIPPGRTFDEVIEKALDQSRCVVVLWSRDSVTSNWVKAEAEEGLDRHILVPVLLEDVKVPLAFRRIQAARLVDWRGDADDPEFRRLVKAIAAVAGEAVETPQPDEIHPDPPIPPATPEYSRDIPGGLPGDASPSPPNGQARRTRTTDY